MKQLSGYCKSVFKKIHALTSGLSKHLSEKQVHGLRIEIKKLKALLSLVHFVDQPDHHGYLKELQHTFKGLGNLRDTQILEKKIIGTGLHDRPLKKELSHVLHQREKNAMKKLRMHFDKSGNELLKKLQDYLQEGISSMDTQTLASYFNSLMENISQKIHRKNLSAEEYHRLRMELKELKNNLRPLSDEFKKQLKNIPDTNELDKLETLLGEWHDEVVMSALLKKLPLKNKLSDEATALIEKLIHNTEKEGDRLLSRVRYYLHHEKVTG